jgi:arylsulfatase A-like enzyme
MTSIYFNRLCRALVLLAVLLEFSVATHAESLSDIFTNVAPAARPAIPRRASIIFIQVDGLGYGDLSCYGQQKFQTPNLDKLGAEGIRFTNYFGENETIKSQTELMFGKNSGSGAMTVVQILKNSGYRTGLIGEWDLGDENSSGAPWRKGFDEFAGYLNSNDAGNFYADYIFRYAPKSIINETNNQREDFLGREMLYPNTGGQKSEYVPDLLAKAALNFIKNNLPDQSNRYRPFFLLLDFKIPNHKIEVPTDAPFSEESWPQPEKNKAALISRIDDYVGQLRGQLQKIRMTNNVVIFFSGTVPPKKTAEVNPEFFRSNISTNDLRVPMIVHWPGSIPAGQVSGFKWSAQDFLPTVATIAFANSPTNLDGISVVPFLRGESETNTIDLPDRLNLPNN